MCVRTVKEKRLGLSTLNLAHVCSIRTLVRIDPWVKRSKVKVTGLCAARQGTDVTPCLLSTDWLSYFFGRSGFVRVEICISCTASFQIQHIVERRDVSKTLSHSLLHYINRNQTLFYLTLSIYQRPSSEEVVNNSSSSSCHIRVEKSVIRVAQCVAVLVPVRLV